MVSVDESQTSNKHERNFARKSARKSARKNARKNARTLAGERALQTPLHFYQKRNRFYTGLLLFVVVIGLPVVSVPRLRNRLSARILLLKDAVAGNVNPAVAQVGANTEPFPAEYERPEPPVNQVFKLPPPASVIPQTPPVYIPAPEDSSGTGSSSASNAGGFQPLTEGEETAVRDEAEPGEDEEPALKYQQGEMEQEAYDLLLGSNPKIAEMVRGSDSSLTFDSWDAVYRGDDVYWVRVKFQVKGDSVRDYIWQVDLGSKEVTPLSYHARAIS